VKFQGDISLNIFGDSEPQLNGYKFLLSDQIVIVKAPLCVYKIYSMRGCVERLIQHETKPSAVFALKHPRVLYFSCTQAYVGDALSVILYFLVIWL